MFVSILIFDSPVTGRQKEISSEFTPTCGTQSVSVLLLLIVCVVFLIVVSGGQQRCCVSSHLHRVSTWHVVRKCLGITPHFQYGVHIMKAFLIPQSLLCHLSQRNNGTLIGTQKKVTV